MGWRMGKRQRQRVHRGLDALVSVIGYHMGFLYLHFHIFLGSSALAWSDDFYSSAFPERTAMIASPNQAAPLE